MYTFVILMFVHLYVSGEVVDFKFLAVEAMILTQYPIVIARALKVSPSIPSVDMTKLNGFQQFISSQ